MKDTSPWTWTYVCMAVHVAIAFSLAFVPLHELPSIVNLRWLPIINRLINCSIYPDRIYLYWQWMVITFPVMLIAFTLATPIKLKKQVPSRIDAIIGCCMIFIIFGVLVMPFTIWSIFLDDSGWSIGRLDRIFHRSCSSPFNLGLSGAITMVPLCCLAWLAYVAPTLAAIKLSKR